MRQAVWDSSTLILLARCGLLGHLSDYVESILVPDEVFREVVTNGKEKGKEDVLIIEKMIEQGKLKVVSVTNEKQTHALLDDFRMNRGEAEAVALCLEKKVLFLGVDDREALKACRVYGIAFVTALAFVVKLAKDGRISKEEAKLAVLKLERIGFYSKDLVAEARKECGLNG